jgi:3',5'-cyclic AMP phosphodiesterase CpdA
VTNDPSPSHDRADALSSFRQNDAIVALPKIRIVHLSDLHFVTHRILTRFEGFSGLRGHDRDTQRALQNQIENLKPDLLFITGDQTTWGDRSSLRTVRQFILDIATRIQIDMSHVVWIPGNHDILLHYYFGSRFMRRNYDLEFGPIVPTRFLNISGYDIAVFSFDSTLDRKGQRSPLWPLVGSRGEISRKAFNEFNEGQTDTTKRCDFRVALVHHHPLPIPYKGGEEIGLELTTMTNGGTFIAYMQESGMDLVLHGHEHYPYSCRYCFDPNRPSIILAAAGTACQRRTQQNSFNYLEIVPGIRIVVRKYDYTETGFRRDTAAIKVFAFGPRQSTS